MNSLLKRKEMKLVCLERTNSGHFHRWIVCRGSPSGHHRDSDSNVNRAFDFMVSHKMTQTKSLKLIKLFALGQQPFAGCRDFSTGSRGVASLLPETSREVANKSLVLIMYRMKGHTKPIF